MALDQAPDTQQGAPASTTEATNAKMLNTVVGKLLDAGSASSAAVIAAIMAVASAITASLFGGNVGATANRIVTAKGATGLVLQGSGASVDASGNINTNGGDITCDDITGDDIGADAITANSGAFANSLQRGGNNVAIVTQTIGASFTFKSPEAEAVHLILDAAFAWTITSTVTITEVGTATVEVVNNGTGINTNSASTTRQSVSQNSAVATGSDIYVIFTSVSSDCENLCLTIWGTRVLAS